MIKAELAASSCSKELSGDLCAFVRILRKIRITFSLASSTVCRLEVKVVGALTMSGRGTWGLNHSAEEEEEEEEEAGLGAEADSRPKDIKSEVKMPKETEEEETVRADFVVDDVVVEVKSCVCADYQKDSAPPSNKKDRYVIVSSDADSKEYIRTGIFPIGKLGQDFEGSKVVSARCIKHLRHLAHLASSGKPSCLLLVVNRGDCKQFRPCFEACPMFAREFDKAVAAGVRIVAAGVTWNEHGDSYFTKLLPILSNDQ